MRRWGEKKAVNRNVSKVIIFYISHNEFLSSLDWIGFLDRGLVLSHAKVSSSFSRYERINWTFWRFVKIATALIWFDSFVCPFCLVLFIYLTWIQTISHLHLNACFYSLGFYLWLLRCCFILYFRPDITPASHESHLPVFVWSSHSALYSDLISRFVALGCGWWSVRNFPHGASWAMWRSATPSSREDKTEPTRSLWLTAEFFSRSARNGCLYTAGRFRPRGAGSTPHTLVP